MKAALKRKWIAALRSGKYKQGTHYLRMSGHGIPDEFCCLGVLADVIGERWTASRSGGDYSLGRTYGSSQMLPDRIALPLGLGNKDDDDAKQQELSHKNDYGWSFKRIATWIEKNL